MQRSRHPSRNFWTACRPGIAVLMAVVMHVPGALDAQPPKDTSRVGHPDRVTAVLDSMKAQSDSNERVPLFRWRDAALAAGFGVATVAFFQLDKHVAVGSQSKVTQANQFLKGVAKPSEFLASPGGYVIEGGLYLIGRLGHSTRAAQVGWHGTEALLVAGGITTVLKDLVGRSRPFVSADTNPHDFRLGGGFSDPDRTSFPSGHTSTAFALAAAVTSESRARWPGRWWSDWLIGPALYGGATVVGISRMYHNDHWASDVVLAAAIGTFSGIKVIQYVHDHPNNLLDRIMLHGMVVPQGHGGVAMAWSLPGR